MVAENLAQVQKNINESCSKINRDPNEVTLIAVSKTKPVEMLKEAYDAGARVLERTKCRRSWINMIRCLQMSNGI